MPQESALQEFMITVRDVVKQKLPKDLVYVDSSFGMVPNPQTMDFMPAVIVSLMSPSGQIGLMHQAYLFFAWGELRNLEIIRRKVDEYSDSLAKARSSFAAGAPG